MALQAGIRIGVYEIVSALGAGGMGEVYRARDAKLGRDVAVKVLPSTLTSDPDRLARFSREAQVLASLNHPNIAAIYHVEETTDGPAIVMELVEGETLADRIARGPIPLDEALPIAKQIAEALEAAHEQGIIHRDLKPANIKLTPSDAVKVLDFGLAKLSDPNVSNVSNAPNTLSISPTITSPAMMTGVGMLLGTAAYMSPEQAKGRPADKRNDVWAFGCVLYEMLTGRRAFEGDDVADTIAAVLRSSPDWSAFPRSLPDDARLLVQRCLERDITRRIGAISTVLFLLNEGAATRAGASEKTTARYAGWKRAAAFLLTAAAAAAVALVLAGRLQPPVNRSVNRFSFVLPEGQRFNLPGRFNAGQRRLLAISPDGSEVAYIANNQLNLRMLDELEPRTLVNAGVDVGMPFFSPDGRWVGFYTANERRLKKVSITGGAPIAICDAENVPNAASWAADDTILFARPDGVARVSARGGKPELVVKAQPGELMEGPQLLPDGDHILLTTTSATGGPDRWDRARIVAYSRASGERKVLLEGGADARYVQTGHLIYAFGQTLFAAPFNARKLALTGEPVPVSEGIARAAASGAAHFSVAGNGTLAYVVAYDAVTPQSKLVLVNKDGSEKPLSMPPGRYTDPRISPDGKVAAVTIQSDRDISIWIFDLTGQTSMRRLTFEGANVGSLWSHDGRRLIYRSTRATGDALVWQSADGSGPAETIYKPETGMNVWPNSISSDGSTLFFYASPNGGDIWSINLSPPRVAKPLITVPTSHQDHANISPNGRWLSYRSDESGRFQIYVQPFPPTGAKYQLTNSDGMSPQWSPDGKQLFYVEPHENLGQLVSIDVRTEPTFAFSNPRKLPIERMVTGSGVRRYDVSPDGSAFIMMVPVSNAAEEPTPQQIAVTLNWFEELRRLAPAN